MYFTKDEIIDNVLKKLCLLHPDRAMIKKRMFAVDIDGGGVVFALENILVDRQGIPARTAKNYSVIEHVGNLYLDPDLGSEEKVFVPVSRNEIWEKYSFGWAVEVATGYARQAGKQVVFVTQGKFDEKKEELSE